MIEDSLKYEMPPSWRHFFGGKGHGAFLHAYNAKGSDPFARHVLKR